MREHRGRPLALADEVVFTCQSCGACCRNDWLIGVDEAARTRLEGVDWRGVAPGLPAGPVFVPLAAPLPGGQRHTFARAASGACVFLTADARCTIHRELGHAAKPQVCREFPYTFVETPDGVAVGVSFACTAVRGRHGRPLAAQRDEILDVLEGSGRVGRVPDPIVLYSGVDIGWNDYRPIEAALLAIFACEDQPLATCFVAGSALVNLAVSLVQYERRAGATGPGQETLASALARLEADGYRRLFEVAATLRPPRRRSLAHLAPLHTWLRLSRQDLGPVGLVLRLYADYVRFRRGTGRIPDLVTGGAPVDLRAVARVRFTTSRETDALLRAYWRHALFRKTLTPLHGVFRGYHVMLAMASFTRWAARVAALQAGRDVTTPADVDVAVQLVEQRFVLHARFAELFSLSPVFTVLADRLLAAPGFVAAAALDPPAP